MTEKLIRHKLGIEIPPQGKGIGPIEEECIRILALHEKLNKMAMNPQKPINNLPRAQKK